MSVQTAGQPTPGLASALLSGSTNFTMFDPTPVAVDAGQVCMQGIQPSCPVLTLQGGGTGCAQPMIQLIQQSTVGVGNPNVTIVLNGSGFGFSPQVNIDGIGSYPGQGGDDRSTTIMFSTIGASAGDHLVTVTANQQTTAIGNAKILKVVCAVPTNFHLVAAQCTPLGTLQFAYGFSSSTGVQGDIAMCYVGELVTYNGTPQSPPFPQNSGYTGGINPLPYVIVGDSIGLGDYQLPPDGAFLHPYSNSPVFVGGQVYRYHCPCQGGPPGTYTSFPGYTSIPITRQVSNGSGAWYYYVSKQGYTCSLILP